MVLLCTAVLCISEIMASRENVRKKAVLKNDAKRNQFVTCSAFIFPIGKYDARETRQFERGSSLIKCVHGRRVFVVRSLSLSRIRASYFS